MQIFFFTAPSIFSATSVTDLTQGVSASTTVIDLNSEELKVKLRCRKHDTQFKGKVIQKKEEGTSTSELIYIYKRFKLDKTKISK